MAERRYLVLEGSEVVNVIIWDDTEVAAPEGLDLRLATGDEGIGWKLVNDEWVAPIIEELSAPVEDTTVTDAKYQGLAELMQAGISESTARLIVGLPPAEEVPA